MRLWMAALLLAGCASAAPRQAPPPPAPPGAPEVRAVEVSISPIVDGVANDAAWSKVPETEIALAGGRGGGPESCQLKAAVHRGTLFLMLRWRDPTEDRMTVSTTGLLESQAPLTASDTGNLPVEDIAYLLFGMNGAFPTTSSPPCESVEDMWRWCSYSTDTIGHAWDGMRIMYPAKPSEFGATTLPDGRVVRGECKQDEGESIEEKHGETPVRLLRGSPADVLARGQWKAGEWTLEVARALRTGHSDDLDFTGLKGVPLQVLLFDSSGSILRLKGVPIQGLLFDSSEFLSCRESPVLRLLLPPPLEEDRRGPLPEPLGSPRGGR